LKWKQSEDMLSGEPV